MRTFSKGYSGALLCTQPVTTKSEPVRASEMPSEGKLRSRRSVFEMQVSNRCTDIKERVDTEKSITALNVSRRLLGRAARPCQLSPAPLATEAESELSQRKRHSQGRMRNRITKRNFVIH